MLNPKREGMALARSAAGKEPAAALARVLVVDDDDRNLLAISSVLESVADVVTARSGEEALRFVLKEEFAVILLDVFMPDLDGYETARMIRQREQSRLTPIIFLTAMHGEDTHVLRGYDMGAVDFVLKPFEPLVLKSKVAVFVDLFNKTQEIKQQALVEQKLLEENLKAHAEKLEMEQALRAAEQRQALLLRSLPLALYVEEQGAEMRRPGFIGGDLVGLTGFAEEDFREEPGLWHARIHPEDRERAMRTLQALKQGGAAVTEYRWMHPETGYKHFLDQAVLLRDASGAPPTIAGTLLDITETRRLEDQLIQVQKLDAIGKLTGGLAHDFNNLLAAVLGGLGLIERRVAFTEDAQRILEMTRHAAKQGAELVNRMLAFSRRQQLRPGRIRLGEFAETMRSLVAPALGGLIRCDWRLDDELWPAYADSGQLELALMNLILNARDAMPSGGTITIGGENRSLPAGTEDLPAGDYVVLVVEDTGCGIAPENVSRVVEPFFTTKEVGKGTGLGLSTVYGFAKQSGGTLRISSTVGRGTVVELWLPRSAAEAAEETAPAANRNEQASPAEERVPAVLLVDDSGELLQVTAQSLADAGLEVVCAAGGAEALALIERQPERFDVIVTDYAMPIVSGLEVIRFARNLRADWPAIIISGYADVGDIANRPADVPLLTKPFAEKELIEAIRTVAGKANPVRQTAPQARAAGS